MEKMTDPIDEIVETLGWPCRRGHDESSFMACFSCVAQRIAMLAGNLGLLVSSRAKLIERMEQAEAKRDELMGKLAQTAPILNRAAILARINPSQQQAAGDLLDRIEKMMGEGEP